MVETTIELHNQEGPDPLDSYRSLIHAGFAPLNIERGQVPATEIFSEATVKSLLDGRLSRQRHSANVDEGTTRDHPITLDSALFITENDIPAELRQQRITGEQLEEQAAALLNTKLLNEIKGVFFTEAKDIVKKYMTLAALKISSWAMKNEGIVLRHGANSQVELSWRAFLNDWVPGVDLYKALQSGYEAYHAQMVGFIPEDLVGTDMSELMNQSQDVAVEGPIAVTGTVYNKKYLGLYNTVLLDKTMLEPKEYWISQDQVGRIELAKRLMSNVEMVLDETPDSQITIIDYAGGVGNSAAAMIEQIDTIDDPVRRQKMIDNFRVVVRDINVGQLEGGKVKYKEMEKKYPWITGKYAFVESDVTQPMTESQLAVLKTAFGEDFDLYDTTLLGMTSYTAGALPGFVVDRMAEQIKSECFYFSANDFSSPAFREKQFLEQTGAYGQAYLETQHGKASEGSSKFRQLWVRAMSLGAGLAKHYNYTWPGEWGHNSGYGIKDDGSLRMSSILELATSLDDPDTAPIEKPLIKSTVNSFSYLYTGKGKTEDGNDVVRVAVIPGWVRDDISVYRENNRIPKNKRNLTSSQSE